MFNNMTRKIKYWNNEIIALTHVYVRLANFTPKPRFRNVNL